MNRKEFILKGAGLIFFSGLSLAAIAGNLENTKSVYKVIDKRCEGCGHCFRACRHNALQVSTNGKAYIDQKKCKGCGDCLRFCKRMAIVEIDNDKK